MRIVNLRLRGWKGLRELGGRYCGRGSVLGNPFVIGRDGSRSEVVAKFKRWLWAKVQARDEVVLGFLKVLDERSVLGCWCCEWREVDVGHRVGQECHCEVIVRCWRWMKKEGRL